MYLALEISTVLFPEGLLGYRALESKAKKNDENFYILSYSLAQFHLPPPPALGVELKKPQIFDGISAGSRTEQAWRTKTNHSKHWHLPWFEQFYLA